MRPLHIAASLSIAAIWGLNFTIIRFGLDEFTPLAFAGWRFVLAALPVGAYDVRAELAGFKSVVRQGVPLTVGEAVALEFTLEVGELAEAVSVIGAAPAVNTRTGDLSYLVDERTIE